MAQNTKSIRIIVVSKPPIKSGVLYGLSVLTSTSMNMVDGKEFNPIFSTALTSASIIFDSFKSEISGIFSDSLIRKFFVIEIPFMVSLILFFWMKQGISFGSLNTLISMVGIVLFATYPLVCLLAFLTPTMQTIFPSLVALKEFKCGRINLFTFRALFGDYSCFHNLSTPANNYITEGGKT